MNFYHTHFLGHYRFNNILVLFGHLFNGFKLVKEFLIGKGIFYEIIGVTVHQKIGSNFEEYILFRRKCVGKGHKRGGIA